jgi:iron(III) transport system ATP-binding protein
MNSLRIEADNIVFSYADHLVLRQVSFSVEAGELFAVVGPSGSGKTTLLRVIAGLARPSSGHIRTSGAETDASHASEARVGMVFQTLSLWPHMTVFENVAFGIGEAAGAREVGERVTRMLDMLDIADTQQMRPDFLSGGQRQRVALARALVSEPRLLLLDDPFANVEHELRVQMRHDLRAVQRRLGITSILVTHDLEDALAIADRVAVVVHGRIEQVGSPAAICDFPASPAVARFVGVENFIPGIVTHIENQGVEFSSPDIGGLRWNVPRDRPSEGRALLGIRPHALHIHPVDSFRDGRYAWFEGKIVTSEFLGEVVRYQVAVGSISVSVKQLHFLGTPPTPSGTCVLVGFDPTHARVFPA